MATSPPDSTPVPSDHPAALPDTARRLAQREAAFTAVVEAAGDVIVQIDAELRVTYINPAAARAAGVPASEIVGRAAQEIPLDAAFKDIWLTAIRDTPRMARAPVFRRASPRSLIRNMEAPASS